MPDVITIDPAGGNSIAVKYSGNAADALTWDGKNAAGQIVSNGIYEIQIVVKNDTVGTVSASKTVSVLNSGKISLGKISIVPDPFNAALSDSITINWEGAMAGRVNIKILDVTGGLVRAFSGDLSTGSVIWDTRTGAGARVTNGLYIVVIEARSSSGYMDRKVQKLAIIRSMDR